MIQLLAKSTRVLATFVYRRTFPRHLLHKITTLAISTIAALFAQTLVTSSVKAASSDRPNIILVMADDMGWGQTGYYNHPTLKTPNLDAMADSGLRLDRFYAGAPVCSPTRASVLTGRTNDRAGVESHGYALRRQERTLAQALRQVGYVTGHFGKWHLNGLKGPGVPIFASDDHNPGEFGFDQWVSTSNFFDRNPILSRAGKFEEFEGDSSEIAVAEATKFINRQSKTQQPFLTVIWFGTPHSPWTAAPADKEAFVDKKPDHQNHYGELVAMDRSIGNLRKTLRDLKIADNTLVWFCSDNGGLAQFGPETVGGLRGHKGNVYEGGLRVPCIIEWPAKIRPRVSKYPACTTDIFSTLSDIVGLDSSARLLPQDGASLVTVFDEEPTARPTPLGFRYQRQAALIDNDWKILTSNFARGKFELYHLGNDPNETTDLAESNTSQFNRMKQLLVDWNESVSASFDGNDYPEKRVSELEPKSTSWYELDRYKPFLDEWKNRPEYKPYLSK